MNLPLTCAAAWLTLALLSALALSVFLRHAGRYDAPTIQRESVKEATHAYPN